MRKWPHRSDALLFELSYFVQDIDPLSKLPQLLRDPSVLDYNDDINDDMVVVPDIDVEKFETDRGFQDELSQICRGMNSNSKFESNLLWSEVKKNI